MFPRNPSRIFMSRWSALLWAAGVIFFAVTTIGFGDSSNAAGNTTANATAANQTDDSAVTDVTGSPVSKEDMAVLKHYIDGK